MDRSVAPRLDVYVQSSCPACAEALRTVERARAAWPALEARVQWVDVAGVPPPPQVFAVPTLMLDGELVSLGTPSWPELAARVRRAFEERGHDGGTTPDER
ncbi:MAG: thioredoxin family protein [Dehalococcoidia bacterium]